MALIATLRDPQTIRDRAQVLYEAALADRLAYFRIQPDRLGDVADYVLEITRQTYPTLEIPFHSRWRHFEADRVDALFALLEPQERARAQFDLVIPSVLLDAGAGEAWRYQDTQGRIWRRSEGLAIATFEMFRQGLFSGSHGLQTTASGLQNLTIEDLAAGFQVTPDNPIVGLEGRWHLLQTLGQVLQDSPYFLDRLDPRPGHLVDLFWQQATESENPNQLAASHVLKAVLETFGEIWPGRHRIDGVNLGDVGMHSALTDRYIPFHKLSQWLTYSLLEPLQDLGFTITGLDDLTGLAEYRNGGLFLDLGLLQLKQPDLDQQLHAPTSELIVEWRGLTIALLDRVADRIRQTLNLTAAELPLVKVLQGGTWNAGRAIAQTLRPDGSPPLKIKSDGTVF